MRKLLVFAMMLALVGSAMAYDLGAEKPAKPAINAPVNVPNPMLQGGDTILDAVVVELPVINGTGTTAGYNDDYDEVCPYGGSTSPDVVYTFTPAEDLVLDVDLCGSLYDTKVYVYDENLGLVACNDDFYFDDDCGVYVSKIEGMPVMAGMQYFVIVDGYGGDFGEYTINIEVFEPCDLTCPAGAELENEPPLVDGYADAWNGGCNSPEFDFPFQQITQPLFCGISGWYLSADGSEFRDTDWYHIYIPEGGVLEIIGDAEQPTFMFELGPQDCDNVGVLQNVPIGDCDEGTMTVTGNEGDLVWFWVGPQTFTGPVNEYEYVLLLNLVTPVENHSFSQVKALFE